MKRYRILVPLIWLAFFLRLWQLPHLPPGLWYDEAYYAMDATWLLDGGPWHLFFSGNNGREPLFIYGQALFVWLFGAQPLTSRLLAPLIGTLTVPLVYVLAQRLGRKMRWSAWLPYLVAAWLATSFWHLGLSRGGYRGILLPLATGLVFYTFWRGWQQKSWRWLALAGLALGASQYTYLAARVLPLVLLVFAVAWTALHRRDGAGLKRLWLGLGLMAVISAAVFAPLGLVFYRHPALFSARTGDVFFTPASPGELLAHTVDAIRLFVDSGDPNWRHHLPGRPMLGWLGWLGFWPGLFLCLRRLHRASYLFLSTALVVLFLPALLAEPPIHALRLASLLPVYPILFALGLTELARWLASRLGKEHRPFPRPVAAALVLVILVELGLTAFDYFGRWAGHEETYVEYSGPLVDLVREMMAQTRDSAVIIPLQLYLHPTTRYLLHDQFPEQPAPPALSGPARLVTMLDNYRLLNTASIPVLPAFVWLARDAQGRGAAYVSRPPRPEEEAYLATLSQSSPVTYRDRFGRDVAALYPVGDSAQLSPMFTDTALRRATGDLVWDNLVQLDGYEVRPEVARPGQPITLTLSWRSLTDLPFDYRLFLQIIDGAGNPVSQWEGKIFHEDMYRWRPQGLLTTRQTLWLGPEAPPGPYLIRMGFFDEKSGRRLPLYRSGEAGPVAEWEGGENADQVQLGLFYVSPDGTDPRRPAKPLAATFAESIELQGVTVSLAETMDRAASTQSSLPVTSHWRALRPTDKPYTVFLQLLDERNKVVSGWDSQPFGGLYPTTLWSPGEIIADTFLLPFPEGGLPPGTYRLITGFYDVTTGQRLPLAAPAGGDSVELAHFVVP